MSTCSPEETMTVAAARLLRDHRVVFAGIGVPLVAAALARRRHAPNLTIVLEGGIVGTRLRPGMLPRSTNEIRAADGAQMLTDISDIFLLAQRGFFGYGFLGVAQIDPYGNINTSMIGTPDSPKVRLPGSGGANDIASLCNETLVVTAHEPRRFVDRVDFITSPGYLTGGNSRAEAGLVYGGISWVVTDLALMDFAPGSRRMRLRALQPGVTVRDVTEATGFELIIGADVERLAAPEPEELTILRELNGHETPGPRGTAQ
jgi:glutaconate CoA-transferase, subunit B